MAETKKQRQLISLVAQDRGEFAEATAAADLYVEADTSARQPARQAYRDVVPLVHVSAELDARLANWSGTVRGGFGGGRSACASWASMYIASRARDGNGNDDAGMPAAIRTVDELDGWLVEGAVRNLAVYNERMVLRYHFVFRYPEHWIRTKLLVRQREVRILMARGILNLQLILADIKKPDKIPSNNLHAGNDPRPESVDVPLGAKLSLE